MNNTNTRCGPCQYWGQRCPQEIFDEILITLGTLRNVTNLISSCSCGHFVEVARGLENKLARSLTTSYSDEFVDAMTYIKAQHYEHLISLDAMLEPFITVPDTPDGLASTTSVPLEKAIESALENREKVAYKKKKLVAFLDARGAHLFAESTASELQRRLLEAEEENRILREESRKQSQMLEAANDVNRTQEKIIQAALEENLAQAITIERMASNIRLLAGTVVHLCAELNRVRPLAAIADSKFSKSSPQMEYRNPRSRTQTSDHFQNILLTKRR